MKFTFRSLVFSSLFLPVCALAGNFWKTTDVEKAPQQLQLQHPAHFLVYTLDEAALKLQMFNVSANPAEGVVVTLPMPDGTTMDFNVWQNPMMPDELANQYPDIRTFSAEAVGKPTITAKLDFTLYGFHAMIYNGDNTSFVDPYDNFHDGFYMVHYKKDETRAMADRVKCLVTSNGITATDENGPAGQGMDIQQKGLQKLVYKTVNGAQLRTYKLALACDHQYAQAATGLSTPTVAQTLSKMTTSMNRINGIYEREFSIHMNFVTNENSLIFVSATGDPFGIDNSNASNLLTDCQTQCDAIIGNANYDIGHVFTTGSGGLSLQGCVCQTGIKAQSTTGGATPVGDGFDVDYVAHEMGHEFGGSHPFNNGSDGSCGGGNINPPTAYEPGSGSTIMAYAGICGPDDLQPHSDPYFHTVSLNEIQQYISTDGDVCPAKTSTGNKLVKYNGFTASYSIPYLTPFELSAPALTDSVADSATLYCWEEWDLGDVGQELVNTHLSGPIFRSYNPTTTNIRVFPKISMVLAGTLSNAGTEGAEGEKVPDVARQLTFLCTFRDIYHNYGSITVPDDRITLNAVNTGAGFAVTSQGTSGIVYSGHTAQTVTWNVVGTTAAPISAANVDIYMSLDGGNTWAYHVGSFPNTGSASITVPNPAVSSVNCRFKVKGSGNVFFNVNSSNFTVNYNSAFPVTAGVKTVATASDDVNVFPVPAGDVVHISSTNLLQAKIVNTLGQQVWYGAINGRTDIPVAMWARGVYYIQFRDENNQAFVKRFILQ